MPAYNAEETITESIKSVINQMYKKWELIIIDNGSTDKTSKIVNSFSHPKIKLISIKEKSVSKARNIGIKNAKGDFISFLDADDIYYFDTLEKRILFIKKNPEVIAIYGTTEITDGNFQKLNRQIGTKDKITFEDFFGNPIHINSLMVKKSIIAKEKFEKNFSNGEDWLLFQRIARQGIVFYNVPESKSTYAFRARSTVTKRFYEHEQSLLKVINIVYSVDKSCKKPLKEYKYGLKYPSKEYVILKRQFALLFFLILAKDYEKAEKTATFTKNFNLSILNLQDLSNAVKYAFLRFYIIKDTDFKYYWRKNRKKIKQKLSEYYEHNLSNGFIRHMDAYYNHQKGFKYYLKKIPGILYLYQKMSVP